MSSEKDLIPDTKRPLLGIHRGMPSILVEHLIRIQEHAQSRQKTKKWASRLRFLDIASTLPGCGRQEPMKDSASQMKGHNSSDSLPLRILRLTERQHIKDHPYVAVSWRWKYEAGETPSEPLFRYKIITAKGNIRPGKFPSSYYDRVLKFAEAHSMRYIWIDKECINQEDESETNTATQAMDRVYRNSKFSVGLLRVRIEAQNELDALSELLSGSCFIKHSKYCAKFRPDTTYEQISNMMRVVERILEDERWKRSWIFQEDICASDRMYFLIPHGLWLSKMGRFNYGNVSGELQIRSDKFRQAVTKLVQSLDRTQYHYSPEIFRRALQYNIWNRKIASGKGKHSEPEESTTFQCTTLSILADLELKGSEYCADMAAILANCCDYPIGLDLNTLKDKKCSLSTTIVALYFLNGELFKTVPQGALIDTAKDTEPLITKPMAQFLRGLSLDLEVPGPAYELSFMKHLRFPKVELTPAGIQTCGWVLSLRGALKISYKDKKWMDRKAAQLRKTEPWRTALRKSVKSLLWLLVFKLNSRGFNKLAGFLVDHMEKDKKGIVTASTKFLNRMVEAVFDASREQHGLLFLGYLNCETQPSGIFVCPPSRSEASKPKLAFTSWARSRNFVSVEVESECHSKDSKMKLSCISWMNGVWDTKGHCMETFTFGWPF